ncbi:MAG: hypothetical protein EX271_03550 [Acidimicrobiales bacterium]|nr:hypothetical protein [Hyphomonadaceae bacterium]RZV43618.1 MAG: hypothetical protein EX271_03550 [Acidimicrobiales bacterium]
MNGYISNDDIVAVLYDFAELLEIDGADPFRVQAYRAAAATVTNLPKQAAEIVGNDGDLTRLPNIGTEIARNIVEIIRTGEMAELEELEHSMPVHLVELARIPGLGAKRVKAIVKNIDVFSPGRIYQAACSGKLAEIPGIGEKTQASIKQHFAPN